MALVYVFIAIFVFALCAAMMLGVAYVIIILFKMVAEEVSDIW